MLRFALLFLLLTPPALAAGLTAKIRSSHVLHCGIIAEQSDFEWQDTHGNLAAFDTDMCRALAGALLGGTQGLRLQSFPDSPHGLQALHDGRIDVLYGVTPRADWALHYGVAFAQPVFFDGQSVMVPLGGAKTLNDLADKPICFIGNTVTETRLRQAFVRRHIPLRPFPFQESGEMEAALVTGHCAAESGDLSALAEARTGFHAQRGNFRVLPDLLTLDPFSPAVPGDDTAWLLAVDAVSATLIQAEADGITRQGVTRQDTATIDAPLMQSAGSGAAYGLADGWRGAALAQTGNYGEVFTRDLGDKSPLHLQRGPNRLWEEGGMMWSPPSD